MKMKSLFAALLMVVAVPSMATVITDSKPLGDLSVPGLSLLGNTFSTAGSYDDQYSFTINQSATAGGLVLELDPALDKLDLDITKITLASGTDSYSPNQSLLSYDFGFLTAGSYTLDIFSTVSNDRGLFTSPVGYVGVLSLGAVTTRTASVPEPGTLALFGVGLLGVALATRRRAVRS